MLALCSGRRSLSLHLQVTVEASHSTVEAWTRPVECEACVMIRPVQVCGARRAALAYSCTRILSLHGRCNF